MIFDNVQGIGGPNRGSKSVPGGGGGVGGGGLGSRLFETQNLDHISQARPQPWKLQKGASGRQNGHQNDHVPSISFHNSISACHLRGKNSKDFKHLKTHIFVSNVSKKWPTDHTWDHLKRIQVSSWEISGPYWVLWGSPIGALGHPKGDKKCGRGYTSNFVNFWRSTGCSKSVQMTPKSAQRVSKRDPNGGPKVPKLSLSRLMCCPEKYQMFFKVIRYRKCIPSTTCLYGPFSFDVLSKKYL